MEYESVAAPFHCLAYSPAAPELLRDSDLEAEPDEAEGAEVAAAEEAPPALKYCQLV